MSVNSQRRSKTRNQISEYPENRITDYPRTTLIKGYILWVTAACAKAENKDLIGIYGHFADFLRLCARMTANQRVVKQQKGSYELRVTRVTP